MRKSLVLVVLFVAGCEDSSKPDLDAARQFVRSVYSAPHLILEYDLVEGPEYATIPKIPRERMASGYPDRSADGGVRVRFTWKDENRTTHDDMIVWVSSDHKGVGWSSNVNGDNWRRYVRSIAKK